MPILIEIKAKELSMASGDELKAQSLKKDIDILKTKLASLGSDPTVSRKRSTCLRAPEPTQNPHTRLRLLIRRVSRLRSQK